MLWTNIYNPSTLWTNYSNVVYNDSGDDDNNGLRIWVLHHLVLTVCSLFVQHKLSSQKGRRHLERFSRKYIELCPIIVTVQRCRTWDLIFEKVWLCFWQKCRQQTDFQDSYGQPVPISRPWGNFKVVIEGGMFQKWYIMMVAIVYHNIYNEMYEMNICKFATC